MYNNGFIDGVFSGLHYGHINSLFQAKRMSKQMC
jgi:glycerol-3-phosphate cytidylyltransferase-like family protein